MSEAESPRTLFELLYLFFEHKPRQVVYDNGCNFLDYVLNRDPEYARGMRVYIDAMHFKGHTCGLALDTGMSDTVSVSVTVWPVAVTFRH